MTFCKYLTSVIFIFCFFHKVWPSCVFQDEKYDLLALDWPDGWKIAFNTSDNTTLQYVINLCGSINSSSGETKGCENSSVCQIGGNQSLNFGDSIASNKSYYLSSHTQTGFTIYLLTQTPCGNKGNYRSSINFACGPNLGVPQIVLRSDCQVNIYWKTSAACQVKPKTHQVPCYVTDDKGETYDLSHLIWQKGGYAVDTIDPTVNFVINVCSDIVLDNSTRSCPEGSAACLIDGNQGVMFGKPDGRLQHTKEGLLLTYTMSQDEFRYPGHSCPFPPKTTVLFKCPQRGFSIPPRTILDSNCQHEIEWETEHACPQSNLKSNIKDCQFSTDKHGIEIDLSSLKPTEGRPFYRVKSRSSNTTSFAISVCGPLKNFNCGPNTQRITKSVCMIDKTNETLYRVVGSTQGSTFMYADHEVVLVYPRGEHCEPGVEYSSEINFVCDPNVEDDQPPIHLFSENCTHLFEWRTKRACLKHPLDTPCSVTYNKKKFNLQNLLLTEGEAYVAVDRRSAPSTGSEYFINVCSPVSHLGNLSKCGEGSSACLVRSDGRFLNLGNFTESPMYDASSNSLKLEYTGGSPCKNDTFWRSTIHFICRSSHINSEPVLTRIDEANCHYVFEWHTTEACPQGTVEGTDCKVYDSNLDVNFDLNPLRSKVYKVVTKDYRFYLGVCEPVNDSPCSKNPKAGHNVGVCQEDKVAGLSWNTGEPSSNLSYTDGVVNLTYMSGDPYDEANQTARMTVIIFICDFNAGHGIPVFIEKVNYAYVFHWYTDLVCPSVISTSIECLTHDPQSHLIYDLSGLSMSSENWMTLVGEDNKELRIYMNVCRSLVRHPLCDPSSAVCVVEIEKGVEKPFIPNIGTAAGPPSFERPGHLQLTYTNGNPCTSYGRNSTYSSVVHFLCTSEQIGKGPTFLNKVGNCEYAFLWSTTAACPTSTVEVKDSCQLTDPESGFTFDLTPLKLQKTAYKIELPHARYQLNVCGRVSEGCTRDGKPQSDKISVCQVDDDDQLLTGIATADNYSLSYSIGQDLTLTYKPNTSIADSVIIRFPCYNGDADSNPTLVEHKDGRFVFEIRTRRTCVPDHVNCAVVDDSGNEYDLSPLRLPTNNWEISDNQHIRYHINFCGPLNKLNSYKCPGGASSACETNILEKELSHDLGWFLKPPIANRNGSLTLQYTNGSYCPAGFQRRTTINLYCSKITGQLIFVGENPECEYFFSLNTPAACPLESSHGSNCMVTDPVFGYTFDLNPLKSKNNNYNLTVGEYEYLFNICDKLNGATGQCANSSVCQTKPSDNKFAKNLGLPNDNLVYRKGLIMLEYESGSGMCHEKYNRSTIITFTCHHGHEDKDGPTFAFETEDCTYLFEWPTVHACPPFDVIECSVVDDKGVTYDLSPLSQLDENYYLKSPNNDSRMFVINICRSVVHTPTSLCPYTAASCLVDNINSTISVNLGKVSQAPYKDIEDGKIKIKYTSGDPCSEGGATTSRFWETVIEFSCDQDSVVSEPEYVGKDDCTYYFDWPTIYACSERPEVIQGDCKVIDPVTLHLFDISALGSMGMIHTQEANHRYYFNICSKNDSSPCGADTGVCQAELVGDRKWKAGLPNNNLTITGTSLFLNFSSGDPCHGGKYNRNTIIEFTCGSGMGQPKYVYETSDCTYYFHWETELACQTKTHCVVENGTELYDLSRFTTKYHAAGSSLINDDSAYYISVCGNLPANICPHVSGICRVSKASGAGKIAQSLGQINHPPMIDFQGFITLLYSNGSACEAIPSEQNRARIIFICDSLVGMGEPILVDSPEECYYLFEWRSNLVCPKKHEEDFAITTCNYTDSGRGIHFDLSPLRKTSQPYVVDDDKSGNHFELKVCSSFEPEYRHGDCKTAGVCEIKTGSVLNYGQAVSQKFTYDGRRLRLTFYDGDSCPSGLNRTRTSEIFFVCDPNQGYGSPVLHKKYTCLAVFMWKTSLVCENMQRTCSFDVEDNHYDFNLLSSLSHNWNTSKDGRNYWINICRGIQQFPENSGCSPTAAVCMMDNKNNSVNLGNVQTMEAKSINATDLLLTFESGDTRACEILGPNLTPVTRLFMRCGTSLGYPRVCHGPDSKCFYDFIWESSLACPERAEQVLLENGGIIEDAKFGFLLNITDILNRTYSTVGLTGGDKYSYEINLSGLHPNSTSSQCQKAAVCQEKISSNFTRDIGTFDTRKFILRESELHLQFTSTTKACGKNKSKNVTTIINMQCSSDSDKGPEFVYESGDCDYIFNWETPAVCPSFGKIFVKNDTNPLPNPFIDGGSQSSHKTLLVTGLLMAVLIVLVVGFVVAKPERRARVSQRFRILFGRVNLPYFRYKRINDPFSVSLESATDINLD